MGWLDPPEPKEVEEEEVAEYDETEYFCEYCGGDISDDEELIWDETSGYHFCSQGHMTRYFDNEAT